MDGLNLYVLRNLTGTVRYHYEMINTIIKWIALCVTIAGAICTTLQIDPINIYLGNFGALLYMTWAIRIKDVNIALVNLAMLTIYGYGLYYRV